MVCGCSGKEIGGGSGNADASGDDGGSDKDAERGPDAANDATPPPDSSARDAGVDCGQPPAPEYMCSGPAPDGGMCGAYGSDASTGANYPINCQVTLPECPGFFPGPQICYCQNLPTPDNSGPTWICPM
jgi:hypothetical protein